MRKKITPILVCPKCKAKLKIESNKESKNRIHNGKLLCKKCNAVFEIADDIVCFKPVSKKDKNERKIKKIKDLFFGQEYRKEWLKHFTKEELLALKKEWRWMINVLNLKKSKMHLDWATGTGRFLRNILRVVKGEIIALEVDYATCVGLKAFLKKLDKYSKVTIVYGDAENMPFADNSIDSISSWHGLDEPNIKKAINESRRVLKRNKIFSTGGLFYEKESKSFKIAKKEKIEFAEKDKAYKYFKKLKFRDIKYKTFFTGKESDRKNFLPRFGDYYTTYIINGRK